MKKIMAALLAAMFLLGLTSCGKDTVSSPGVSSKTESQASSAPTESQPQRKELKPLTEYPNPDDLPKATVIGKDFAKGSLYNGPVLQYRKAGDKATLGVWWWSIQNLVQPADGVSVDQILDCLLMSNVTEIYLCLNGMLPWSEQQAQGGELDEGMISEADVRGFVSKCTKLGLRVAALGGSTNWVQESDKGMGLYNFMDKVNEYQTHAKEDEKLYGVHLDVEPHTLDDFEMKRSYYCQLLANLTADAAEYAKSMNLLLEWDIYSYFENNDIISDPVTGQNSTMLDVMFTYCDTVTVMTYYNNGLAQFERGQLEAEHAKKHGKKVVLSSETIRISPSSVSYYVPGKAVLVTESEVLRKKTEETGHDKYGFAVHHAVSFYALMMREK